MRKFVCDYELFLPEYGVAQMITVDDNETDLENALEEQVIKYVQLSYPDENIKNISMTGYREVIS